MVITVALDQSVEAIRPYVEAAAPTHPSLIDTEHRVAELYSMINIPTIVWIDERGRIVRPPDVQFANDAFIDFHGIASAPHIEALRRWVKTDELPYDPAARQPKPRTPTFDEQLARAEFRLAWHLHEHARAEAAERHFVRAGELSPFDWTVRRAALPIRGRDPMGPDFFEMYQQFKEAGSPSYDSMPPAGE